MAYDYSSFKSSLDTWLHQAEREGWINQQQADTLKDFESEQAQDLFQQEDNRPLIVAFMGGTGVGKSSLINKLAEDNVARTGVERPTSKEVTLYYHQTLQLQNLSEIFPMQQIQTAQHALQAHKNIIWIDMPDFDSTEKNNKTIVMQWLPFVDVLIYVVSPERYKDNKAWQLLLAEGASHAWVFVLNQWDKGDSVQLEDFKSQLIQAGFEQPLVFKTSCLDGVDDEFTEFKSTIVNSATEKNIQYLESRSEQHKQSQIQAQLQQMQQTLGSLDNFEALNAYQATQWQETQSILAKGFQWPLKQVAHQIASQILVSKQAQLEIWDEWAQSRLNDHLDGVILKMDKLGIVSRPLRESLQEIRAKAEKVINTQSELACRQALINPGHFLHRFFLKTVKVCELLLPLIAMCVVGFQVYLGFYQSSTSGIDFLGMDYVVHSLLLILISWLIPFFILKKLQPSLETAAFKGLNKGLDVAFHTLEIDINQAIQQHQSNLEQQKNSLSDLMEYSQKLQQSDVTKTDTSKLQRMLNSL